MNYKVRVRSKALPVSGRPGKWMIWAAFNVAPDAYKYADELKSDYPTWDVTVYQGKALRIP